MITYLTIATITFIYINLVLVIKFITIVNPPFKSKKYDHIHMEIINNTLHEFSYFYKNIKIATYCVNLIDHTVTEKTSGIQLDGFYPIEILMDYNEYKRNDDINRLTESITTLND